MLHAILMKFPKSILDSQAQTFFIHLVAALSNDTDSQIHSMVATIIKELIERTSESVLNSIMEFCISWYTGDNHSLWSAAAQVLLQIALNTCTISMKLLVTPDTFLCLCGSLQVTPDTFWVVDSNSEPTRSH